MELQSLYNSIKKWYSAEYTEDIIRYLCSLGSSELGFRLAGTDAEHEAASYIKTELERLGVDKVELKEVYVDRWIFKEASLRILSPNEIFIVASSYAGSPPGNFIGEIVFGGKGDLSSLDNLDLDDKIVLIDMDYKVFPSINIIAKEMMVRGAKGIVLSHLTRGGYASLRDDTLYASDGDYSIEFPPIIHIRRRDAISILRLLENSDVEAEFKLDVAIGRGYGYNVIGYLNNNSEDTICIGAHHDAHFRGAIDNASGVALLLNIARYVAESNIGYNQNIRFISFTAEEYGRLDTPFDFLIGSYDYINSGDYRDISLYINLDVVGYRDGPIGIVSSPDIKSFILDYLIDISRYLASGVSFSFMPYSWIDMWNFITAGIPSIHFGGRGNISYYKTYYHTELDTLELLSHRKFMETLFIVIHLIDRVDNSLSPISSVMDLLFEIYNVKRKPNRLEFDDYIRKAIFSLLSGSSYNRREARDINSTLLSSLFKMSGNYPPNNVKYFWIEYLDEIGYLSKIRESLAAGDYKEALKTLCSINLFSWASKVSKETYHYIFRRIAEPLYWGSGKTHNYIDLYGLYESIRDGRASPSDLEIYISDRYKSLDDELKRIISILELIIRGAGQK
jgi:Iap family predicted aminopeptidase